MVDIIKFLPRMPTSFPSNTYNLRSKPFCQQIILPVYLSNTNNSSPYDRLNNIQAKRWIGRCPADPPRLLDISTSPYSIHRKIMFQELSRNGPTKVDLSNSLKSRQQQRNTNKDITTTTTAAPVPAQTTTGTVGANTISQSSFSSVHVQSSRLFDTLSKHVTIKAEPLRPSNSFINSSTNTLTSWQRYWTSTHTQRRRKEANDQEPVLHRSKREQILPGQTHFVVLRDSPHPNSEYHSHSQTPSTPPESYSPTKSYISSTTPDKQFVPTKEDDTTKEKKQISIIEPLASSLIPAGFDINSSINASKTSTITPLKSTDKDDEKHLIEKSILLSSSSSYLKSDSQIIEEVADAQCQLTPITTKIYKLSLSIDKPKTKKPPKHIRTRSKSAEKKEARTTSASKRKRQMSTNQKSSNKSIPPALSTIMTTTPRSKYSQAKWDEPYVGFRFDPPPPPCSPSLLAWLQDSDQEENDGSYERSEVFEHKLTVKVLES